MSFLDSIIANEAVKRLDKVTAEQTREFVKNNGLLFCGTPDSEWESYRSRARLIPGLKIDYDTVVDALAKHRPDLLAAISCTPGGVAWLHRQVEVVREKLGLANTCHRSMRFRSGG